MQSVRNHVIDTINLAYPVMIGQLGMIMMGVVDTIMVGGLGATPLAAASLANSLFILVLIIGLGISYAVTPLVAISIGANKLSDCTVLFRQSFVINLSVGILLMIITIIFSDLIKYMNQPAEVARQAISYTKILGYSMIPGMLFQTYKQFIEGFSVMKPAMLITLLANIINGIVNWVLIYGKFGFPKLELNGAGWATFSSRIFMGIVIMFYVINSKKFSRYKLELNRYRFNIHIIKKILDLGIPSALQYVFEVGAFSFAVIMIGWLGTKQLAAHQIAMNLASISFMAALGISSAGAIRVGNAVGKQDVSEVRKAGFTAIILGASLMACSGVIFISLRKFLPSLYINDPVVIQYASVLLIIAAIFQISDGTQAVGIGILRGLTDVKGPTVITFIAYWVLALPTGYLLGFTFHLQVVGVWIGLLIGLTASGTMLTIRFNKKSRSLIIL